MTAELVIQNGRVVTPGGVIAGGVAIAGETIVAVGADRELPAGRRRVDARDQYVLPGLIDAHVHMASEEDDGETVGKPGWGRYAPRGPAAAGGTA